MKKLLAAVLSILLILCFAGCGEKQGNGSQPKQSNGEAVVVGYIPCEPMIYSVGSEQLAGFEYELAKKVFDGLNMNVTFKEINPENIYSEIENGSVDCVLGGLVSNISDSEGNNRTDKLDFSYNYLKDYQVIVTKQNEGIDDISKLKGVKGAVQGGTSGELFAKRFQPVDAQNQSFTLNVESFAGYDDCIGAINAGTAKFAIIDVFASKIYCGGGDVIYPIFTSSDAEYISIGLKKGSALTEKVNSQLEELGANGTITKLAGKYNASGYEITDFFSQK